MQRTGNLQVALPSWGVNASNTTTTPVHDKHRGLSASPGSSSFSRYSTESGTGAGRQYFSCLQWECEPGHYSASLPNCYHDSLSPPSDDFQTEESDVEECSDDTCCAIEETNVYTCKDYPYSCPTWHERSLVACTWEATDGYPICGEVLCCGVVTPSPSMAPTPAPPTPTPSVQPTPAPSPGPTSAEPTLAPTRSPTPAPPTPTPAVQHTPAPTPGPTSPEPTQAPTRSPTPAPPTPTPSVQRTPAPTPAPTSPAPTQTPTRSPTPAPPTPTPSVQRTPVPTPCPRSPAPTQTPTRSPTPAPLTPAPSVQRTPAPTPGPTRAAPTLAPTRPPTPAPPTPTPSVQRTPAPTPGLTSPAPTQTPTRPSTPAPLTPTSSVQEIVSSPTFAPEVSTMAPSADTGQVLRSASVATATASAVSVIAAGAVVMATVFSGSGSGAVASRSAGTLGAATSSVSVRPPSATLAWVLTGQLQFIATLSLVESTGAEDSLVSAFANNMRWVNIWPPESTVTGFTHLGMTRRLQETESVPRCEFSEAGPGEIGVVVFIGNLVLVVGFLVALFVVHVALASGAEAYWLEKHHAEELVEKARHRGASVRDISDHRWTRRVARIYPSKDAEAAVQDAAPQRRLQQWHSQSTLSPGATRDDLEQFADDTDEENDGRGPTREESRRLNLISECRDHLNSKWLHFPHVELLFLFFAFEGAVAAQVSALRGTTCSWVIFTAVAALLLFPVLMIVLVFRTIYVRVRPDDVIVFETATDPDDPEGGSGDQQQQQPTFLSRVKAGWDESSSLLAWADKGQWTTTETADREAHREGDLFRIGFEPLFVDYTKHGALFMVLALIKTAAMSCVAVLVDESSQQLWLFFGLHFASCLGLALFKPFANGLVNTVGACLSGVDAICMALLAISASEWEGTDNAQRADTAVMIVQLVALVGLVIPMYVDTVAVLIATISKRARRIAEETITSGAEEERKFIHRYIRRTWASTWCKMLGKNMFACVKDTSAGIRRPQASTPDAPNAPSRAAVVHGTAAPTEFHTAERLSSALPPPA